ncbi:MAG: iron-sulfur cluster assembly accessory protein [Gemmatimonadaceae bacterium]|nr:iron-sulfur cluster assembly accessory protein [Gloeobacterales cyanobacterium ES-bin-141]
MIEITEAALREVKRLQKRQSDPELLLRLGVTNGGCSGMSYSMGFDRELHTEDQVYQYQDVRVTVDGSSLQYLNGLTLDFTGDLMGGGFRFHNPNALHTCGCGSSFTTSAENLQH